MRRIMIRVTALLMVVCITLGLIIVSGYSQQSKKVTIKFMGWEASPLETKSVKNGLSIFMKRNPNIKVEYTVVPGSNYASKLLTMLAGNAAPDVFFCYTDSGLYRTLALNKQLLDITDYFKKEYKENDFLPATVQLMKVNGRYYGVISCIVGPVLFYNKDVFKKAKIAFPPTDPKKAWTWEQFRNVAKKLTIKQNGKVIQYGVYGLENPYMLTALVLSNGGKLFNSNYTKMTVNNKETAEVLQKVLELRKVDGAAPDAITLERIGMRAAQMLQTGKVAMLVDGSWALQELSNMNFEVGMAVLPKFKKCVTHVQAHMHSAWAKTKYPQEAWKLISFLSSDEYQCQNVKEGLWLPDRKSLYTEEGKKKWFNEKVYGPWNNFKPMIEYFLKSEYFPFAMLTTSKVYDIWTEELQNYFESGKDLQKTLIDMEKRANAELAKR